MNLIRLGVLLGGSLSGLPLRAPRREKNSGSRSQSGVLLLLLIFRAFLCGNGLLLSFENFQIGTDLLCWRSRS